MSCIIFIITCSIKSQNVKHKITVLTKTEKHRYIDIINGATAGTAKRTENPAFIPIYKIKKNSNIHLLRFNEMSYLDKYGSDKIISTQLEIDNFYHDKYNKINSIRSLVDIIEKHVAEGDGIIIPPYFEMMRDLLSNYKIFFTDKHDGNLILGGRIPAGIILERMKMLYSVDYTGMFHLSSRLQSSSLRNGYRDLTEDTIRKINKKHPAYRYFLTENDIKLNLEIVFSNDYWSLYKL